MPEVQYTINIQGDVVCGEKIEFEININFTICTLTSEIFSDYCLLKPAVPHILTDQLTLSQPGRADYAHQIILASPDFPTFLRPCAVLEISPFFRADDVIA